MTDKTPTDPTPAFIASDRYGGQYPDPATMCQGQCEGLGVYPHKPGSEGETPGEAAAVVAARAEGQTPDEIGYMFIKCPDCGGTGKAPA